MSYLSKNEAENLQNGNVHLAQIADSEEIPLVFDILRTIWPIEVSDGSFFFIFQSSFFTLFHLSLTFFNQSFPFNIYFSIFRYQVIWRHAGITVQTFPSPTSNLEVTGLASFQILVTDSYQSNL